MSEQGWVIRGARGQDWVPMTIHDNGYASYDEPICEGTWDTRLFTLTMEAPRAHPTHSLAIPAAFLRARMVKRYERWVSPAEILAVPPQPVTGEAGWSEALELARALTGYDVAEWITWTWRSGAGPRAAARTALWALRHERHGRYKSAAVRRLFEGW